MVALISCILKKPDLDEEDLGEDLDKVLSPKASSAEKSNEPISLSGECHELSSFLLIWASLYHWRDLPQVSFLSRQKVMLLQQKYACRDKTFVAKTICLSRQIFFHDNIILSRQAYFCRGKRRVLSRQK